MKIMNAMRLKEGPPLLVPIEMWATLPKGECVGSWTSTHEFFIG
jgi:hypothetical protein